MSCEEWIPDIEELVYGQLDEAAAHKLEVHIAECGACRNTLEDLNRERALFDGYERDVEVTPALWEGIENRIEFRKPKPGYLEKFHIFMSGLFAGPRLNLVYTTIIVVIAVIATIIVMPQLNHKDNGANNISINNSMPEIQSTPMNPARPTDTPEKPATVTPKTTNPGYKSQIGSRKSQTSPTPAQLVREAEQKYIAAIAILTRDVKGNKAHLSSEQIAQFEKSLMTIDKAIADTRKAVREHPDDPLAVQYMLAAYGKKIELLREMSGA